MYNAQKKSKKFFESVETKIEKKKKGNRLKENRAPARFL